MVSNAAFSFSIISVLMGVTATYNTGLRYGGPMAMTLGWLVVAAFNRCVALSMAEICSAYPTSGGLYYWSAKLAGKNWAPFASWITGWCVLTHSSIATQLKLIMSACFLAKKMTDVLLDDLLENFRPCC